ncbi:MULTISPECIES: lytic polysaccharide monooxygenase [Bacillus]|uniref:Chitin-binding protein n=5 Tax=Bacillus toyonensis TaxID=155322 RepID=A0A2C5G2N3_9BACI|nr:MULTISPECIES: lytic polysaccharide monooxygenase [Bacillus]EOP23309.1 chitin binding protein [Bacillus cereus VD131]KXY19032.1 chitin-binding protein [Bacillus cereus]MDH8705206.1 chitin-binding protein [Stenotrophomonas sp. 1198]MDP9746141.1 chitin-binding protein [Bacillus thuringiensis]OTX39687.1 chitin-binding protein [Bacillus thuringiensis serovar malayensis]OUB01527.1 chitin-binding protein [Bacillus thuringiensis serovar shandongiensis]
MNNRILKHLQNMKMNKKSLGAVALTAGIIGTTLIPQNAYAHGFVEKPGSRSALCSPTYGALNVNCGSVMYEPQSLEAPKGFPQAGPVDGQIASAGGKFGGILDQQTADRWFKNTITGGENTFTWKFTAPHLTSKWHYYITKIGWNPNKALTRADFEPIGTVQHDGSAASNNVAHKINVPTDRSGYHVILAVWDVADTANAFYNVIDVNLINNVKPDTEAPSIPNGIQTQKVTANSIELTWNTSTDNVGVKGYQIFRNGEMIDTVPGTHFIDKKLQPSTEYSYTVKAIDAAGNVSKESTALTAKTTVEAPDTEAPTQPKGLHSMGTTASSVDLMWSPSDDNVGVDHYDIYREIEGTMKKIATSNTTSYMDNNLLANKTYKYVVKAVDVAGNESVQSDIFTITTKTESVSYGEWDAKKAYKKGDRVLYEGKVYEAVQNHQGNGDPNWIYALSLWRAV